jgi:RimJ/RimL family protein N-acetyltransferase
MNEISRYHPVMVDWVRLQLNVVEFNDGEFAPYLSRACESGIEFATFADFGDTTSHRQALYDLNKTCSADIPERGEFYTYDEYVSQRIDAPSFRPDGVVLAVDDGVWIGMSGTSLHPAQGHALSEMTGVLAPYRGRGLSLALKLLAIRFVRSSGYRRLVAFHHPRNVSAIAMNRRLGFVDQISGTIG